jgi:sulfonate transport system ATP-binding protein
MSAAIDVKGLTKGFVSDGGRRVPVLRELDLTVKEGDFVSILGPTGCGKTTLLRLLTGLLDPDSGDISVAGAPPDRGRAGLVFQQNSLFPWKKILRNVTFPLEMRGVSPREAAATGKDLLGLVGLSDVAAAYPWELSGGMQQRAAIARALAGGRDILLMDEPFGALDDSMRLDLQEKLLEIHSARRMTILFVTHNIEEALSLADRIVVLGRGVVLTDEEVDLPRPRDRLSAEFGEALLRLRREFASGVPRA